MSRHTFIWGIPRYQVKSKERWLELYYFINLLIGSLILYTIELGKLPLRDWDEGTVAQVAKEIYHASFEDWHWLFPTMWGEPYLNKPPLIHSLTAVVYHFIGVSEFSSRIVPASLTALSVPLLYLVAKELFLPRYYAVFSALVYLTMIPVVRHGRLAMLDGGVLCFYILFLLCVLKTRRDLRWSYPAGVALALICLCKGWMLALLLGSIVLLFIIWDTPRLVCSLKMWSGLILGIVPAVTWYVVQYLYYGQEFVSQNLQHQSLARVFTAVEGNQGPIWYYFLELLKYPHPWIFFAVCGLGWAWRNRNWSWAKLILVTSLGYLLTISLMGTKLPWYIMPIYPTLSLATGVVFAQIKSIPSFESYPRSWANWFSFLTIVVTASLVYFITTEPINHNLLTVLGLLLITFLTTTILLQKKDQQFIYVLFWGMYIGLIVFFSSNYWLWELNEAFAVKPIAQVVQKVVPADQDQDVYLDFDYHRPSLDFYSDRKITPVNREELQELLHSPSYLLVQKNTLAEINLKFKNSFYCSYEKAFNGGHKMDTYLNINCWQGIIIENSEFTLLAPTNPGLPQEDNEIITENAI